MTPPPIRAERLGLPPTTGVRRRLLLGARRMALALWAANASCGPFLGSEAPPEAAPGPMALSIRDLSGDVAREREGATAAAAAGMSVLPGDRIITGPDGRAILVTQGGDGDPVQQVRIGHGTSARVVSSDEDLVEVELERGLVRARVRARPVDGAPQARVRVTAQGREVSTEGGEFGVAVRRDGGVTVDVTEGRAAVAGAGAPDQVLTAGQRGTGGRSAPLDVRTVDAEPLLDVTWPTATRQPEVEVTGRTEPGSQVRWVGPGGPREAFADGTGRFVLILPLQEGETTLTLEVQTPLQEVRRITGTVVRDSTAPRFEVQLPRGR